MSKKVDVGDDFYTRDGCLFDEITGTGYTLSTGSPRQFNLDYEGPSRFDEARAAALRAGFDWAAMVQARLDAYEQEHGCTIWESVDKTLAGLGGPLQ